MLKLKHLYPVTSKGKKYWYVRVPGKPAVRLKDIEGTPAFRAEYDAVLEAIKAANSLTYAKGTLGYLIEEYRASEWFTELKPKTKESYQRVLGFLQHYARVRLTALTRPAIIKMRDEHLRKAHGDWSANYCITILGVLFKFAIDANLVAFDPLEKRLRHIRRDKSLPAVNRPWTDEERETVLAEAPTQLWIVLALAMSTGLRKGDLLKATMGAIKDGEIAITTAKRDVAVRIPLHALAIEALERRRAILAAVQARWDAKNAKRVNPLPETPEPVQIAITGDGTPWTYDGFNASWLAFKGRLEAKGKIAPGLTIHGIRHTMGHLLHEEGATDRDIADVLAHKGTAMAGHYSKDARMSDAAKARVISLPIVKKR